MEILYIFLTLIIIFPFFSLILRSLYFLFKDKEYEKHIKILSALGVAVIPIIIAFVGWQLQSILKNKDIDSSYVKMAISILQDKETVDSDLRRWAVKIIDEKSSIPFSDETSKNFNYYTLPSSKNSSIYLSAEKPQLIISTSTRKFINDQDSIYILEE